LILKYKTELLHGHKIKMVLLFSEICIILHDSSSQNYTQCEAFVAKEMTLRSACNARLPSPLLKKSVSYS